MKRSFRFWMIVLACLAMTVSCSGLLGFEPGQLDAGDGGGGQEQTATSGGMGAGPSTMSSSSAGGGGCSDGTCEPDGSPCQDDRDCESLHCVDGVCCDRACDALCESCLAALTEGLDGRCAPVLRGTDPENECAYSSVCIDVGRCGGFAISAGQLHSCAALPNGRAQCWGYNAEGQLGFGNDGSPEETAVNVKALENTLGVSAGLLHSLSWSDTGQVSGWGFNARIGNGGSGESPSPVNVAVLSDAVHVAAFEVHSCAVRDSGEALCWGHNSYGQLGNGTKDDSDTPVKVQALTDALTVSVGWRHSCATSASGQVWCWGHNEHGKLGDGTDATRTSPVAVKGIDTAISVAAGYHHSCAALADGTVRCWGRNAYGQLGNGTTNDSVAPVTVLGLNNARKVVTGRANSVFAYSCALLKDGTVACWGGNVNGQLGDGTDDARTTPVTVQTSDGVPLTGAVDVSAGTRHTCATTHDETASVDEADQAWCWGYGVHGRLGTGDSDDKSFATRVVNVP